MPTILDQILDTKRAELERRRIAEPLAALERRIMDLPPALNFSGCIWGPDVRLIAEVKKASPSRGILLPNFDPVSLANTYAQSGAASISVLTEVDHFQGNLNHLHQVANAVHSQGIAVLRKDFLFDPYQLYEARAYGADAALLIVAILDRKQLREMLSEAQSLWLQCLTEVHSETELLVALEAGAEVIGINHRDLRTFKTDILLTNQLRPLIPRGKVVVAESGIKSREDVERLKEAGANAVLVGEALVTSPDIAAKVRELTGA